MKIRTSKATSNDPLKEVKEQFDNVLFRGQKYGIIGPESIDSVAKEAREAIILAETKVSEDDEKHRIFYGFLEKLAGIFKRKPFGGDNSDMVCYAYRQGTKLIETTTSRRQNFASLSRLVFYSKIEAEDANGDRKECNCFTEKYAITGQLLCDQAYEIFTLSEKIQGLSYSSLSEPINVLKRLVKDQVKLLENFGRDMCLYWYYGYQHETLLIRLNKPTSRLVEIYRLLLNLGETYARFSKPSLVAESHAKEMCKQLYDIEKVINLIREDMVIKPMFRSIENGPFVLVKEGDPIYSLSSPDRVLVDTTADNDSDLEHFIKSLQEKSSSDGWYTENFKNILDDDVKSIIKKPRGIKSRRRLGSGAYGRVELVVLENEMVEIPNEVAIKVHAYDGNHRFACTRFIREARAWSKVYSRLSNDPWQTYITPLLEIWPEGIADEYGHPCPSFVMPAAQYGNMSMFLDKEGENLSVQQWLHLLLQIAKGLAHLHSKNVVHGDLKPDNILIFDNDTEDTACQYKACLTDFGISRYCGSDLELKTRGLTYTKYYASPELMDQSAHEVYGSLPTWSSDVYSYGCIFIEALTGVRPFIGEADVQLAREKGKTPLSYYITDTPGEEQRRISVDKLRHPLEDEHRSLLSQCFQYIPQRRPSAATLVKVIQQMLA